MTEKTDAELVAAGMAVVTPMIEDSRRFRPWLFETRQEMRANGLTDEVSAWQGWRAGKADLAQQVMEIMERSFVGRRIDGALFDEDLLARLYGLLRQHGAGKE